MSFVYGKFNIAPGENNLNDLKPLWQWNDCGVFNIYKPYIEIRYFNDEGREQSGSGRNKPIGLPNVIVVLPNLHIDGLVTIIEDILDDELIDNLVTVHVPCPPLGYDVWVTRNGRLEIPADLPSKYNGVEYRDVEIAIMELI